MNIGMVGLGKLGLPVAVAIGQKHPVHGYDINPALCVKRQYEHKEEGFDGVPFQKMFDDATITFVSLDTVVSMSDIIFVAVQTPHQPMYEGTTRLTDDRADFDYGHLIAAVDSISKATTLTPDKIVVVISTCLPGTIRKHIAPLLDGKCNLVYNPFFIAMGTVVKDFYWPEFVLLGGDVERAKYKVADFYKDLYITIYGSNVQIPPFRKMSIESAELTKVAYNTFIGMKIAYANTMMEIAHKIPGCDIGDVMGAIKGAHGRLISEKYLDPGMGDGGGCHPRDNIAMSWLARELGLSHDFFTDIMLAREDQTGFLQNLIASVLNDAERDGHGRLPVVILGKAFKPETNIVTGSPSILLSNMLKASGVEHRVWDPYDSGDSFLFSDAAIFLIGTKHAQFTKYVFPTGSVVIDPHRYIPDQQGVLVIRVGEGETKW